MNATTLTPALDWEETLKAIATSDQPLNQFWQAADQLGLEKIPSSQAQDRPIFNYREMEFVYAKLLVFDGWRAGDDYIFQQAITDNQFRLPVDKLDPFKQAAQTLVERITFLEKQEFDYYHSSEYRRIELKVWPDNDPFKTSFVGYFRRVINGEILECYIWSPKPLDVNKLRYSPPFCDVLAVRERQGKGKKKARELRQLETAYCQATKAARKRCHYEYELGLSSQVEKIEALRGLPICERFGVKS